MKSFFFALPVIAAIAFTLPPAPGAQAAQLPPTDRCTSATIKTVKQGNRQYRADGWFTRRLHRARCLDRGTPKSFRGYSNQCRARTDRARDYLSGLQRGFIRRLDNMLLNNQPRLIRLDSREASLFNQRRSVNRQIRAAGPGERASLNRQRQRINRQLITVRTERARINYSINTRAVTRRGAAGVWLVYFEGVVHGCLKAFRASPYLTTMREHFLVQLAAAQYVSPRPTRSQIATWSNLLTARSLSPAGL